MNTDKYQEITYRQFINDFLLGEHVNSITVNEGGRVCVTIKDSFQGADGRDYSSLRAQIPQQFIFHVPDISAFMSEVETIQLEQGKTHDELLHVDYHTAMISSRMLWNVLNIAFLLLIGLSVIPRKGGMNNMMSKAMGIEPKSIEIVKNTGVFIERYL